jgi:hypothetical protein
MKRLLIVIVGAITIGTTTLAALSTAEARCVRHCRHNVWPHNQWGYVGLIQGGWGLGGVADAPWVGGSIIGIGSYGPYPYGFYPFLRP